MARNKIEFSIEVIDRASKQLDAIGSKFAGFARSVAGMAAKLAAVFSIAAVAAFAFANKISAQLSVLDALSKRLNISVEALSQFQYIAERSGVTFGQMAVQLQTMVRNVQDASKGVGRAVSAFGELNISAVQLARLSPDKQFLVIAKALTQTVDKTRQLAIATKIYGQEGASVLQMLDGGIEGFQNLAAEANAVNAVIGDKAVKAGRDYQNALIRLQGAIRGVSAEAASNLLPSLTDVLNFFSQKLPDAIAFLDVGLITLRQKFVYLSAGIVDALGVMATALQKFSPSGVARAKGGVIGMILGSASDAAGGDESLDSFIERMQRISANLRDQASAYTPLIRATEEYHRKLKDIRMGGPLGGSIPEVGPGDLIGIEDIAIKVKRRVPEIIRGFDFMKEAAISAARSIQQAWADFFFDPFDNGLKGLLKNFIDTIRRMVAEIMAHRVIRQLFGGSDSLGSKLLGVFGRASGGPVAMGQAVRTHEGELAFGGSTGGYVMSRAAQRTAGGISFQPVTNIDARGADPGLIARLPKYMEQRDRALMLKVKRFIETGSVPL